MSDLGLKGSYYFSGNNVSFNRAAFSLLKPSIKMKTSGGTWRLKYLLVNTFYTYVHIIKPVLIRECGSPAIKPVYSQ